jgi:hypothetical protein
MKRIIPELKINLCLFFLITCIPFIIPEMLNAQGNLNATIANKSNLNAHQADRWYFGQNAGLDFRGPDLVSDPTNYILNIPTSPAVMADSSGNILFFSDGDRVYNDSNQIMLNGEDLHGFVGYTMPVMIVPKPGNDSIYYIFTTHRPRQNQHDQGPFYGLEYNEINLNKNGGLGEVIQKNIVLLQPEVSSRLSAIKHSNGVDYWVVGHRYDSVDLNRAREFCAFLITEDGIHTDYVSSIIGSEHGGYGNWGDSNKGIGYMKFSPDGRKLAVAIHGSNLYEIFNFNNSTGQVTDAIISGPVFSEAYGIEFSPDSRYFYGTTTSTQMPTPADTLASYLYQFDINAGSAIFSNYTVVATDTLGSYFGGIQLATDGKIYVSRSPYGNAALSVIMNPKRAGQQCNFTTNAIDLMGRTSRYGFPNFVQSYFDLGHFEIVSSRSPGDITFRLLDRSNIDSVYWDFGDPSSSQNYSRDFEGTHSFTAPGDYLVSVTEYFGGMTFGPYTEIVTVIFNDIGEINPLNEHFCSIYPNPGDGNINLIFKQDAKEVVISVRNIFGQQVWGPVNFYDVEVNEEVHIELPDLPEGVFMVQVTVQNADSYISKYILRR